jgi:hypothetical protein
VPAYEVVFCLVCLLTPLPLVVLAKLVTKALFAKYALISVAGFATTLAFLVVGSGTPRYFRAAVLAASVIVAAYSLASTAWGYQMDDELHYLHEMDALITVSKETVVTDYPTRYLLLNHYGGEATRNNLLLVVDPELSARWAGKDTDDRAMAGLAPLVAGKISSYREFVKTHKSFVVVPPNRWMVRQLVEDDAQIEMVCLGKNLLGLRVTSH